ncbi:LruC domain-containing protein [Rhodocytophaga aerolata]|uniref:LruC domain-containing protein n=1 Tax=Rhodocytophaga aerolata TaxID=455078 RepID=A0ABT8RCH5_9BACT|nr:LruC domain-containing protein [Rhodocytophaga aerolata]MDO1449807.1 LruC domain-containing protein [Rhodocytophaga aerolata]
MKKLYPFALACSFSAALFSCQALEDRIRPKTTEVTYPADFDFATVKSSSVHLTALGSDNAPLVLPNIRIYDGNPAEGGNLLYHGATDVEGKLAVHLPIPVSEEKVYIQYNYTGISDAVLPITNSTITHQVKAGSKNGRIAAGGGESISQEYYPYINKTEGLLMYEDNWPFAGDFDLNDVVIKYTFLTNGIYPDPANTMSKLVCKFDVKALGATFDNSFHLELDNIDASNINLITLKGGNGNIIYQGTAPSGVKFGANAAKSAVFDIFTTSQLGTDFINTKNKSTNCTGLPKAELTIEFKTPISVNSTSVVTSDFPYNPFIRVQGKKDREVHLSRKNASIDSSPFAGIASTNDKNANYRYDKENSMDTGMPFAMLVPVKYDLKGDQFDFTVRYALEQVPMYVAFPKFDEWGRSSGGEQPLWYQNFIDSKTIVPCNN